MLRIPLVCIRLLCIEFIMAHNADRAYWRHNHAYTRYTLRIAVLVIHIHAEQCFFGYIHGNGLFSEASEWKKNCSRIATTPAIRNDD